MSTVTFSFVSARTANRLVAGIPAAARLARNWQLTGTAAPLVLVLADKGTLSPLTHAEIARLAPDLAVVCTDWALGPVIPGETLPDAAQITAMVAGILPPTPPADPDMLLDQAAQHLIRGTTKPGDGIVSRYCNRPLSQAVSGLLLRFPAVRPGHATVITAVLAAAMLACLVLLPGEAGLVAGAVLFQLASIADGIDGEIARATFRSSKRGATWDSAVDAVTNAGFFIGAGVNFALHGMTAEAAIAFGTIAILLVGIFALGARSIMRGEPLNFEAVKRRFKGSQSDWQTHLAAITGRDSYCFFIFVMTVIGLINVAMAIMLAASIIWLLVVINALFAGVGESNNRA